MTGQALVVGSAGPAVERALEGLGLSVSRVGDSASAQAWIRAHEPPVLVLADLWLPDGGGPDVARAVRGRGAVVVMRVARNEPAERCRALEVGADDAVGPEVSPRELALRVRAILGRRVPPPPPRPGPEQPRLDPVGLRLQVGEARVRLTPTEARVVAVLLQGGVGSVRPRSVVRAAVWGDGTLTPTSRALDAVLGHLRVRLRPLGLEVASIRRAGLRLVWAKAG